MTDPAPPATRVQSARALPRDRRTRRTMARAACCAVLLVLLLIVVLDGSLHRTEVIGRVERQPASVEYGDGSTHYVGVVQERSLLLDRHRNDALYAGRDPGLGYGHFVRLGLGSSDEPPTIETVTWDEKGVRVMFTSGHELFVPARHFVGGR